MKRFEHINYEKRKMISRFLSRGAKASDIANNLGVDISSISREIKRNRLLVKDGEDNSKNCPKILRFPYVCNGCLNKYTYCPFKQYKYDAKFAQERYKKLLVGSRSGIDMSEDEFNKLDFIIKVGISEDKSIYDIVKSNDNMPSVASVYRYIDKGYLSVKKIDLPYAITYKKRKKSNKKYEYPSNSKIDRSNRTYLDYLAYKKLHPSEYEVQMDFLGAIKTDTKAILTLTIPEIHFVILHIIRKPNSNKIIEIFNYLEELLDIEGFKFIFPYILTDRDPSFSDYDGIEVNNTTGEIRTHIFYCDSFKSNQKGNVENMNKQLRRFFPKKESIERFTDEDMKYVMHHINSSKILSLSGYSPDEAFIRIYGKDLLNKLYMIQK